MDIDPIDGEVLFGAPKKIDTTASSSFQVGGTHYSDMKIQPIDYIVANKLDFISGNIVKYVSRHKSKGKDEDIKKVIQYAVFSLKHDYNYTDLMVKSLMESLSP